MFSVILLIKNVNIRLQQKNLEPKKLPVLPFNHSLIQSFTHSRIYAFTHFFSRKSQSNGASSLCSWVL